jgi:superoxide dismutase, Cu-Zn family
VGRVTFKSLSALVLLVLAAGCAQQTAHSTPSPSAQSGVRLSGAGDLVVYDRALAPAGAQASASVDSGANGTLSSLTVEGFRPGRVYGAHLHANACGAKPDDAGPHYQQTHGQVDAESEVWLDVKTDTEGSGRASARHTWALAPGHTPKSLVIHAEPTKPDGTAGQRVACLSLQ